MNLKTEAMRRARMARGRRFLEVHARDPVLKDQGALWFYRVLWLLHLPGKRSHRALAAMAGRRS